MGVRLRVWALIENANTNENKQHTVFFIPFLLNNIGIEKQRPASGEGPFNFRERNAVRKSAARLKDAGSDTFPLGSKRACKSSPFLESLDSDSQSFCNNNSILTNEVKSVLKNVTTKGIFCAQLKSNNPERFSFDFKFSYRRPLNEFAAIVIV